MAWSWPYKHRKVFSRENDNSRHLTAFLFVCLWPDDDLINIEGFFSWKWPFKTFDCLPVCLFMAWWWPLGVETCSILYMQVFFLYFKTAVLINVKCKGKSIPLQARSGSEGSRKLRFPDFMKTVQDGGKVVSLTYQPPLPPGNTTGTHFC